MDDDNGDSRRSRIVQLTLIGLPAVILGASVIPEGQAMRRNVYADRAACERDYSPAQCQPGGSAYWGITNGWHGPYYFADRTTTAARSDPGAGRIGLQAATERSVRGGFGSFGRAMHAMGRGGRASCEILTPRPDWPAKVEAVGLDFHTTDGEPYWDEAACYAFSSAEIDVLEAATEALHQLCLELVDRVVEAGDLDRLLIPREYQDWVAASWRRRDPDLYGRFDLAYDGTSPPKMLEYNADTPTALLEAAVVQWYWLEEVKPGCDQFNSIHEKLIARWAELRKRHPETPRVYLSGVFDEPEDRRTVEYMEDVCRQAGWPTDRLDISEIGWNGHDFTDLAEQPITALFKLYPWEWLLHERFGQYLTRDRAAFIEPPWKMALSNKAILPLLWERFPGHPNLLPAFFERDRIAGTCVEKPVHGREGADIRLLADGESGHLQHAIYQAACELPVFDGMHALIGSWVIAGQAAGIGLREDASPITTNASRFVPHYFR